MSIEYQLLRAVNDYQLHERDLLEAPQELVDYYGYPALSNALLYRQPPIPAFDEGPISKYIGSHVFKTVKELIDYIKTIKPAMNQLYAIWAWEAMNVEYDVEAYFSGNHITPTLEGVFETKKAVCAGYAFFFKEMAKAVGADDPNIEIYNYSNYAKGFSYDPLKVPNEVKSNHASIYIVINGEKYLSEPTWGSGYMNNEGTAVQKFDPDCFLMPYYDSLHDHFACDDSEKFVPFNNDFADFNKAIRRRSPTLRAESHPLVSFDCPNGYEEMQFSIQGPIESLFAKIEKRNINGEWIDIGNCGYWNVVVTEKEIECHPDRVRFKAYFAFPDSGFYHVYVFVNTTEVVQYYIKSACKSIQSVPVRIRTDSLVKDLWAESHPFACFDAREGYIEQQFSCLENIEEIYVSVSSRTGENSWEELPNDMRTSYRIIDTDIPDYPGRTRFKTYVAFDSSGFYKVRIYVNTHFAIQYYVNSIRKSIQSVPVCIRIKSEVRGLWPESHPFLCFDTTEDYVEQQFSCEMQIEFITIKIHSKEGDKWVEIENAPFMSSEIVETENNTGIIRTRFKTQIAFPDCGFYKVCIFVNGPHAVTYYVNSLKPTKESVPISIPVACNAGFIPIIPKCSISSVTNGVAFIRFAVLKERSDLLFEGILVNETTWKDEAQKMEENCGSWHKLVLPFDESRYEDQLAITFPSDGLWRIALYLSNGSTKYPYITSYWFSVKGAISRDTVNSVELMCGNRVFCPLSCNQGVSVNPNQSVVVTQNLKNEIEITVPSGEHIDLNFKRNGNASGCIFPKRTSSNESTCRYSWVSPEKGQWFMFGWLGDELCFEQKYVFLEQVLPETEDERNVMNYVEEACTGQLLAKNQSTAHIVYQRWYDAWQSEVIESRKKTPGIESERNGEQEAKSKTEEEKTDGGLEEEGVESKLEEEERVESKLEEEERMESKLEEEERMESKLEEEERMESQIEEEEGVESKLEEEERIESQIEEEEGVESKLEEEERMESKLEEEERMESQIEEEERIESQIEEEEGVESQMEEEERMESKLEEEERMESKLEEEERIESQMEEEQQLEGQFKEEQTTEGTEQEPSPRRMGDNWNDDRPWSTKCKGSEESIFIPSWNCGVLLTGIENTWMRSIRPFEKSFVKHVVIPSTLEVIGNRSFSECKSLSIVEFCSDSHVKNIGNKAFYESGLRSICLPSSLEDIGDGCFYCCSSLFEIQFNSDSHLKSIGKEAFYQSGLHSICFPSHLESIGDSCFLGCKSLVSVEFGSDNHLKNIGNCAFCKSALQSICLPSTLEIIGYECFKECKSLISVEFSSDSHLKTIGKEALCCSGLRSICFPSSLEIIGDGCFSGCSSLIGVEFDSDSHLKSIGNMAFYQSGLESICIPSSLESIGYDCFSYCKFLISVEFISDSHLKTIGEKVFMNSSLERISLPSNLERIGDYCFYCCSSLVEVRFNSNSHLKSIGKEAFYQSGLQKICFPSSLKSIGGGCFYGCESLVRVEFGSNSHLESIGSQAFYQSGLESICLPSKLKSISNHCFSWCKSLRKVEFDSNSHLKSIGKEAFYCCTELKNVCLPGSLESIGDGCFYCCSSLFEIQFDSDRNITNITSTFRSYCCEQVRIKFRKRKECEVC